MVWFIFLLFILFAIADLYRLSSDEERYGFRLPFRLLLGIFIFCIYLVLLYPSYQLAIIALILAVMVYLVMRTCKVMKRKDEHRAQIDPEFRKEYEQRLAEEKAREELARTYQIEGIKYCPYCMSTDFQYAGYEMKGRKEVTKSHSWAIPLPHTPIYYAQGSERTKVKRKGRRVDSFVCLRCGKVFH